MNTFVTEKTRQKGFLYQKRAVLYFVCGGIAAVLILAFPEIPAKAVRTSLSDFAFRVLPALFPFAVLSGILMRSGFPEFCGKLFGKAFSKFTFLGENGASAYFLGLFSGFPSGGRAAVTLYENGLADKEETEALLPLCNNAGPSFVISAVGAGLWKSTAFGVCLWLFSNLSVYLSFLILSSSKRRKNMLITHPKNVFRPKEPCESFAGTLTESVASAVMSMLDVAGFLIVFETLFGYIRAFSPDSFAAVNAFVFSVCEIASGCQALCKITLTGGRFDVVLASALTFGAVAFGGLSAFLQLYSFAFRKKIRMKFYLSVKTLAFFISASWGAIVSAISVLVF